jgi:hypothetical protein
MEITQVWIELQNSFCEWSRSVDTHGQARGTLPNGPIRIKNYHSKFDIFLIDIL